MPVVSVRKLAIMALLEAPGASGEAAAPIAGVTRLQKLLFLVDRQLTGISPTRDLKFDLHFEPYRYGPADLGLYQDLEFLLALGHIAKGAAADAGNDSRPGPEESSERALSFGYLMGDEEDAELLAEAEEELEQFRITESGRQLLSSILSNVEGRARSVADRVVDAATDVKGRFAHWPLQRLLRHVYSEYPDMTTSSVIRERVLGRD
jgi:hypothetical protein